MSHSSKKEYLEEIRERYFNATKKEKKTILDEFCKTCNYNRKYAIRLINKKAHAKAIKRKPEGKKYITKQRL